MIFLTAISTGVAVYTGAQFASGLKGDLNVHPINQQIAGRLDWVVLYSDNGSRDTRHTVITAMFGPLRGRRVAAGREAECQAFYAERESTSHRRRVSL